MAEGEESLIAALDEAWDDEAGFLGKLRAGVFDERQGNAYVELLRRIPAAVPHRDMLSSELVKLVWFAPQFIEWQIDRAAKDEAERARLQRIADRVHEAVSEVLGIP
ncbi:hypothetical protein [Micromonospora sp. WMMD1219]|uniref:hypothetical protein n=1 Tax=Micromonospora sp. WMMD1219 TaxID=3404115 RepID=UPI003BF5910F